MLILDHELRTIIDKLAVFVARNGPEFEQMTKTKQKDNHKFEFLFGGRHFEYYLYKVTTEQSSKSNGKKKKKTRISNYITYYLVTVSVCAIFFFFKF